MPTNLLKKLAIGALASVVILGLIAGFTLTGSKPVDASPGSDIEYQLEKSRVTVVMWLVAPTGKPADDTDKPDHNHKPAPHPMYCKCHGTGMVKSGDGIIDVPCPCGDHCKCRKSEEPPVEPEKPADPPPPPAEEPAPVPPAPAPADLPLKTEPEKPAEPVKIEEPAKTDTKPDTTDTKVVKTDGVCGPGCKCKDGCTCGPNCQCPDCPVAKKNKAEGKLTDTPKVCMITETTTPPVVAGLTAEPVLPTRQLICVSATWCTNCVPMHNAVLGLKAAGWDAGADRQALIALFDADFDREYLQRHNIESLPTVIVLNNGELETRLVGRTEVPGDPYTLANLLLGGQESLNYRTPRGKFITHTRSAPIAAQASPTQKLATTVIQKPAVQPQVIQQQPIRTFYTTPAPTTYWWHNDHYHDYHRHWR